MSERDTAALTLQASSASPADILRSEDASLRDRKGNPAPDATLSSFGREGLIMTNRRGSTTARLAQAKTGERLFERTQEHIRPLIGMIDELNEVGAEDELRVIRQQLTRLVFRAQPLPQRQVAPKSRSARLRVAGGPS